MFFAWPLWNMSVSWGLQRVVHLSLRDLVSFVQTYSCGQAFPSPIIKRGKLFIVTKMKIITCRVEMKHTFTTFTEVRVSCSRKQNKKNYFRKNFVRQRLDVLLRVHVWLGLWKDWGKAVAKPCWCNTARIRCSKVSSFLSKPSVLQLRCLKRSLFLPPPPPTRTTGKFWYCYRAVCLEM